MFDFIRNNRRFAQLVLALLMIPLGIFGIDFLQMGGGGGDAVAKVGKQEVSVVDFDQAIRQQTDAMRQQMGESFNNSMVESPVFRSGVLDRLINEKLLDAAAAEGKLVVPDAYVQEQIKAMPEFQENGHFSMRLYEALLRGQGYSPQAFEYKKRKDVEKQALLFPVMGTIKVPAAVASRWLAIDGEERTVSAWILDAKSREASVKLAPDAAKQFYAANPKRFEEAERVKLEYIVLSADELGAQVNVSEADALKWYEENKKARFVQADERRASHILVQLAKDAKPDARDAAKKKAEGLLAKLKADPSKFAELAKANSDDKFSAEKGGDVGFFARGAMVKAFEDTAFSLKPKEVSGVVETEFGFHIIQLNEVRGGGVKSFADAKNEAIAELRHQAGVKRFAEIGEQFGNLVYEQPDALKPIADKLGLKLQTTDWLSASSLPEGVLSNPKVRAAIFAAESIKGKRNSEALDLGRDTSVSVRVADHKPARVKSFDEVRAEVEVLAKAKEAAKLAKQEGEAALAKLNSSGSAAGEKWEAAKAFKRAENLSAEVRKAIFGASVKKLPAYVGVGSEAGYAIFRVEKVKEDKVASNDPRIKQVSERYASNLAQEDLRAYLLALRNRAKVKTDDTKLMAKSQ